MTVTDATALQRPDLNDFPLAEVGIELDGMTQVRQIASPSRARWDGSRILFEITEGTEQISCAISQGALEEIGERRYFSRAAGLLGCFANARGRIERLALEKLKTAPDGVSRRINLWVDDVDLEIPPVVVRSEAWNEGS